METKNAKRKTQNLLIAAVLSMMPAAGFAQSVHSDFTKTKSSETLRAIFKVVAGRGNASTVSVRAMGIEGKESQVAFGTVVNEEGYVLTKASEVVGQKGLSVQMGGKEWPAKVVGVSEPTDLAMLKVDGATGLSPVEWADLKSEKIEVGAWVATCGPAGLMGEEPVAVGVVSVGRRKIPGESGFLGVAMEDSKSDLGASITEVLPGSAADRAGLKVGDAITAVNDKAVKAGADLAVAVHAFRPGDVVTLTVRRAKAGAAADVERIEATLGTEDEPSRFSMESLLSGQVSKRASDFAAVFQHDTVIRPADCGGPLVDLSGKAIGINIARAGRTETYALPADLVQPLLEPLEDGKLAPVNAGAAKPKANDE